MVLDNSTFQTKSEELPHIARRSLQGKKICHLKEVTAALSHSKAQKRAFTLIFCRSMNCYYVIDTTAQLINWTFSLASENRFVEDNQLIAVIDKIVHPYSACCPGASAVFAPVGG